MQPSIGCVRERWERAHPGLDTSSMDIVGPLKRAHALLDLALEPLFDGAELTSAELDVLLKIHNSDGPVIARQVAQQMGRSRAAVSKALAKLEGRALIARRANPADRRASLIDLTKDGARIVEALFPKQLTVEATLFSDLSAKRRALIIDGLAALVETLEKARRD